MGGISAYNPVQLALLLILLIAVLACVVVLIYGLVALLQRYRGGKKP